MFLGGELFGMDFIFNTIPNSLVPFDFSTFMNNRAVFITAVTDCETGEALYYEKNSIGKDCLTVLKASCSLPFVAKSVHYQGRVLMDGGLSDSIPIRKSIDDGNIKNVLILTRPKGYRKRATHFLWLSRLAYPGYHGLHKTLSNRHRIYNQTTAFIDKLEQEGKVFIIRPRSEIKAGRVERNKDKLYAAYDQGYEDAASRYRMLSSYLDGDV
jgi:predicted patatin/cPLA2 family phospholipase